MQRLEVLFILDPVLHTHILYWWIKSGIDLKIIERIINETQAYPEGKIAFEGFRTPVHCASYYGNILALELCLDELYERYFKSDKSKEFNIKKPTSPWYELLLNKVMNSGLFGLDKSILNIFYNIFKNK